MTTDIKPSGISNSVIGQHLYDAGVRSAFRVDIANREWEKGQAFFRVAVEKPHRSKVSDSHMDSLRELEAALQKMNPRSEVRMYFTKPDQLQLVSFWTPDMDYDNRRIVKRVIDEVEWARGL